MPDPASASRPSRLKPLPSQTLEGLQSIAESLQKLYNERLLPVERAHNFHDFYSMELEDEAFKAPPMVLVLGPYSTGKSSFIRHLLGRDYPGLNIGPEPTTDRFVATLYGDRDQRIPGNAAACDRSLPFRDLHKFGNGFLERFEVAKVNSPILKSMTLVDTPGVLSSDKDKLRRGYMFEDVARWFAERSDLVMLLFDVTKMTISDELRHIILAVKGNSNNNNQKLRVILNKADQVTSSQLMRIYGAMLWNLKDVINTYEVVRVYIGSFWEEPLRYEELRRLYETEESDIYMDLAQLPAQVALRRLNEVVTRTRLAKAHACMLDYLRKQLGTGARLTGLCGRLVQQRVLLANLGSRYEDIASTYKLSLGDFPSVDIAKDKLADKDFSKFPRIDAKQFDALNNMLTDDMPKLLQFVSDESAKISLADISQVGGSDYSPFGATTSNGATTYESQWFTAPNVEDYRMAFDKLQPIAGKLTGRVAKSSMVESKLPSKVLHQIWTLADTDMDGELTLPEYALAMHFIKMKQEGLALPASLPPAMNPGPIRAGFEVPRRAG